MKTEQNTPNYKENKRRKIDHLCKIKMTATQDTKMNSKRIALILNTEDNSNELLSSNQDIR